MIENKIYLRNIQYILDKYSFNSITLLVFISVSIGIAVNGCEMTLMALFLIPLKKYYDLSNFQLQVISSALFLGVAIGSYCNGYVLSKFNRKTIVTNSYILLFIFHTILSFIPNYIIFSIARFFIGFFLGLIVPISLNSLTEFLPTHNRSFILTSIWVFFSIGQGCNAIFMLIGMPNFEVDNMKYVMFSLNILVVASLILNDNFFIESPRYLLMKHENVQAFELLNKMLVELNEEKLSPEEQENLIEENERHNEEKLDQENDFKALFSENYYYTTILSIGILFVLSFLLYGVLIISTLTMKKFNSLHKPKQYTPTNLINLYLFELNNSSLLNNHTIDNIYQINNISIINNTLEINNSLPVNKTLETNNKIPINETLEISNKVPMNKTLEISNKIPINNTLEMNNSVTINNTLEISNKVPINNTSEMNNSIIINNTLNNENEIKNIEKEHKNKKYYKILIGQIISAFVSMFGCVIGGALSELSFFGRKKTVYIGFIICCICCFLILIIGKDFFTELYSIYLTFVLVSFNVYLTYIIEVYPTRLRDISSGFLFGCLRVSGFLSQFFYLSMNHIHFLFPYYFSALIAFLAAFFTYKLPYETYNQPLDHTYDNRNDEFEEKLIT